MSSRLICRCFIRLHAVASVHKAEDHGPQSSVCALKVCVSVREYISTKYTVDPTTNLAGSPWFRTRDQTANHPATPRARGSFLAANLSRFHSMQWRP